MKKVRIKNQAAYNVTFNYNVVAENAVESVVVLGDFNEWSFDGGFKLLKTPSGDFEGTFKIPAGRDYHFRYLVNGNRWANEKDADRFEPSPIHGHIDNSVLSLPLTEVEKNDVKQEVKKTSASKKASDATPKVEPPKKAESIKKTVSPKKESTPAKEAPKKSSPAKTPIKKDDLTKIEGIGPKIAVLLNEAGIVSFAELAATKKSTLTSILNAAGSRYAMHDPSTWAQQSKLAASEKWDQLKKMQAELKGGK
ncbi:MAG: hypothetical protein RLZZ546_1443 [Bacteroidota bacterium]|jgi:predicted flap endonuclease-1-like 5' DNA nuclease